MDLGTYKSVDAEIWFGNRFRVIQKRYAAIFEILILRDCSGVKVKIFAILTKFWTLTS